MNAQEKTMTPSQFEEHLQKLVESLPNIENKQESTSNRHLVPIWESYENNGDACVLCATKEQAENHGLFEVQYVAQVEVWLTSEGKRDIEEGKIIWN